MKDDQHRGTGFDFLIDDIYKTMCIEMIMIIGEKPDFISARRVAAE